MVAEIIDGKAMARGIREELAGKVTAFKEKHGFAPKFSVILVGDDEPSRIYVRMKEQAATESGMVMEKHVIDDISESELIELIERLNRDEKTHGILVQLPLPEGMDKDKVLSAVSPGKDIDGFHACNLGALLIGNESVAPCTPLGIIMMLERTGIQLEGKDAVVIGRSIIVGKPMIVMLLKRNATVSACHTRTKDMGKYTRQADVIVSAAGVPGLITKDMVKPGAVVIDAG
ncbi:MAG: bifunctional 5,10-methylenetetrahydrofolate dehydrogenase/5,10-methenyltetrahydrofolate cyclohydrolase, partial [Thermoplasmata archaeon]|nr:bifunctional 5,10-methylenetetrahydrofolate dehydrogenase/5,10-methenyltetrahydrofolate cyclohydrolase [Thermoplasmata archaeon]